MLQQKVRHDLPIVPHPLAPYGAQGVDSSLLIWYERSACETLPERFSNGHLGGGLVS